MTESVWDYPRPPRVETYDGLVEVELAGRTIVSTHDAVRVLETSHPPVFYLPVAAVEAELRATRRRTICEYKGQARYYDVVTGSTVVADAAWGYDDPWPGYEALRGRVAVYPARMDRCLVDGEVVTAQDGDFYGGWITSAVSGPFKGAPGTLGW